MNYVEYKINVDNAESADIAIAEVAEWPFESFSDFISDGFLSGSGAGAVNCYIPEDQEAPLRDQIEARLRECDYFFERTAVAQQNWNELWESNFEPIEIGTQCYIRAPFHPERAEFTHQIVVMPKMSFGTGHHATTHLMVDQMLSIASEGDGFAGLSGLDMGSGTGILSILAAQLNAVVVDAVDIDEWAYENCVENVQMNHVQSVVCPILGDVRVIGGRRYDFILANINRNILLADMGAYTDTLRPDGLLLVSGILEMDMAIIEVHASTLGLTVVGRRTLDGWAQITFRK